eukprot:14832999-Heterocapsa_arctica.AAC.1
MIWSTAGSSSSVCVGRGGNAPALPLDSESLSAPAPAAVGDNDCAAGRRAAGSTFSFFTGMAPRA